MKVKQFGKIYEENGELVFDDFVFDAEGGLPVGAVEAVVDYINAKAEKKAGEVVE